MVKLADELAGRELRNIKIQRSCRMVLHPLAEIVIGMFMAVQIGGGQFMMDILRNGKRRKGHEDRNETNREADSQPSGHAQ